MTAHDLIDTFIRQGILQFGHFVDLATGTEQPFRLSLNLLPAYPETLSSVAQIIGDRVGHSGHMDRLVCLPDSLPVGIATSLHTGVSLVYSQGSDAPPAIDLVGAYDFGHDAALIINTWQRDDDYEVFIKRAERVGLHINRIIALVALNPPDAQVEPIVTLSDIATHLRERDHITPTQTQTIRNWINDT